ncbi:MAG: septum formation inhibitor Maf [Ruminococcaceae bacterium]|nr:septum formation inhibitor Maf [Oscillospiraceae bacterium]
MLILASNSPRRKELLSMLGYEFCVKASDCDENTTITNPAELVKELSLRKAKAVEINKEDTIIGSDTVVAINDKILGKPTDKKDAIDMLKMLSGKTHTVYTGITILNNITEITECISCDVTFKNMTDEEIKMYVDSGEPMDKAGAYGIQGKGSAFVEKINGDYFAVVGFPCCYVNTVLNKLGIFPMK